ncbi:MAG TPA: ABC transporter permease, partial [Vicinamibacteria bacterium]
TVLAVAGIALVVAVLVTLLAMANGFRHALGATGRADNAMVVQRGSASELTSWIPLEQARVIEALAPVARDAQGAALASPEIVIISNMPRRADGSPTNVTIRAVTPRAFRVRGELAVRQGRLFQPGSDEVIVGRRIAERVRGLELGATVRLHRREWHVVGIFEADGSAFESEVWGDSAVMAPAFRRDGGMSSLVVRLTDPAAAAELDRLARLDPQLRVQAQAEDRYYADQAGGVTAALLTLAGFVTLVLGTGAVFGAMNTMHGVVASRIREIGTLRALGFGRGAVLACFVTESALLALTAGLLGCLLALPARGLAAGAQGPGFSEIAFAFQITPAILGWAMAAAAAMGVVGGLIPAWRAARLPIARSLRED